jgi:hypothetical protein
MSRLFNARTNRFVVLFAIRLVSTFHKLLTAFPPLLLIKMKYYESFYQSLLEK